MNSISSRANHYKKQGYFAGMSAEQIKGEINELQQEIKTADKRTYNGKMQKIWNECKINIGEIMIKSMN